MGGCEFRRRPFLFGTGKKFADRIVQKFCVGGIACGAGGVPPKRWNRSEGHGWNKWSFVARVANWKIKVGCGRHVQKRNFDGGERLFHVAIESRSCADVVMFPGAHL